MKQSESCDSEKIVQLIAMCHIVSISANYHDLISKKESTLNESMNTDLNKVND